MSNSPCFKWFMESLREDQKKDYQNMSINLQKDWYIRWLEKYFDGNQLRIAKEKGLET